MHRNILFSITTTMLLLSCVGQCALAQSDTPKFELGAQYALLRLDSFDTADSGVGGRFTYNATRYLACEGEINVLSLSPANRPSFGGRKTEGRFGLKAGVR